MNLKMKKQLKQLPLILIVMLLGSCSAPQFIVTGKITISTSEGSCLADIKPINKRAINKFSYVKTAMIDCWDYEVGDTLKLTRKEFTNY